ncbi:DUF3223 domain-containing protein [Rhodoferax ferrireducens]|uniref:DUF3223 domain-containing protein n=1 Tax=Rhodoferax ferrireducens TaxID=192843 RepID=UPI0018E57876|nr:DUF3223 domain-containing protein [Rhodoferax ferrireducens]
MAKPVSLSNGRTWRAKKDALAHFKAMLSSYSEGDPISVVADHDDLCSLLVRYDSTTLDGTSKIGSGIDHFSKQRNTGEGWSTVGFHVHRTDGTSDDFSYIAAVNLDRPVPA